MDDIFLDMFNYKADVELLSELQRIDEVNKTNFARSFKEEIEQKYPDLVLD